MDHKIVLLSKLHLGGLEDAVVTVSQVDLATPGCKKCRSVKINTKPAAMRNEAVNGW